MNGGKVIICRVAVYTNGRPRHSSEYYLVDPARRDWSPDRREARRFTPEDAAATLLAHVETWTRFPPESALRWDYRVVPFRKRERAHRRAISVGDAGTYKKTR